MSLKNFMSYDDASTVLGEYADKVNELKSGLTNVQSDVKLNTQDLTTVSRSKNNIVMTVESVKRGNTSGTWNGNTYTRGNLTYELLTDDGVVINGINVSGNNSEYVNFNLCASLNLGAGRYTLSQQDNLNNDSCYTTVSTDGSYKAWASGRHGSESYDSISGLCTFTLVCHNFNNANPVTIYPMNRISTETDATYAPYIPSVESRIEAAESGLTNVQGDVKLNTQDLTTPSRTKNLLPMTLSGIKSANTAGTWSGNVYTINDVSFTVQTDDDGNVSAIKMNGTASADIFYFKLADITTTNTKVFSTGNIYGWNTDGKVCEIHSGSTSLRPTVYNGVEFSAGSWWCAIAIKSGTTLNEELWYPMVRNTDENSTYAPYIPSVESRIEAVESGLSSLLVVEQISKSYTVTTGGRTYFSIASDIVKTGYTPLGIVGFMINEEGVFPINMSIGSNQYSVYLNNLSDSDKSGTMYFNILYQKNV